MNETDGSLNPQTAARLIERQTAETRTQLDYPDNLMYLVWGVAFSLGYLPLALSQSREDPLVDIPLGPTLGFFAACIIGGIVASIWITSRYIDGIRGTSARQGQRYGFSWWIAFMGVAALSIRLGRLDLPADQASTIGVTINGVSMVLVGVQFMAGGGIWDDRTQYVVGAVIASVSALAMAVGLPWYYWIQFAIGIGLLTLGVAETLRARRRPSRPAGLPAREPA
ncbi:MAG: hypothetical protein ACK5PP_00275 [Acidimicrobiales bacterium]